MAKSVGEIFSSDNIKGFIDKLVSGFQKAKDFAGHWNDLVIKGDAIWSNNKVERL